MKTKKYVVYLGCSGFPFGLAEVQKIILISKSLLSAGNTVTVVCSRGLHNQADHPDLKATGNFEGIDFVYTPGTPFRSNHFFQRNWLKVKGIINEILVLRKMKSKGKLDYAIISVNSFYSVVYYVFLSKLIRFKTILNHVEYYSARKINWSRMGLRLSYKLYDNYSYRLVDAVFPISEFLISRMQKTAPQKKYLKIPVSTDFKRYEDCETEQSQPYFLFCGAAAYKEIIQFIIDAFTQLNMTSASLYLVINGSEKEMAEIKEYVNRKQEKDKIRIFSKLTQKQLYSYYRNALALLIPLRPTLQDIARFPHKIGEYLASGNPVISTNYGEVKHYFKDMQNMLIADSYDVRLFAAKMQFVIDNGAEAQKIGLNGRNIALATFDYRNQAVAINEFLS
jgi:glycosyltransferase involved in cell wall biosynthesis